MGLILFIIALIFTSLFSLIWTPIKIVWYIITFWKHKPLKDLDYWFLEKATLIDVYGNSSLAILFNRIMIKGNGKFRFTGIDRDTISFTLAVNYLITNKLTGFGLFWCKFLNWIDYPARRSGSDHLRKTLDNREKRDLRGINRLISLGYEITVKPPKNKPY